MPPQQKELSCCSVVWIKLHLRRIRTNLNYLLSFEVLIEEVESFLKYFIRCLEEGLLLTPGWRDFVDVDARGGPPASDY